MDIVDIFIILFLVIFSVLGIYLIFMVKKLSGTVESFRKEYNEIKSGAAPLIEEIEEIADSVSRISKIVEEQVEFVNDKVNYVKNKFNLASDSTKKLPQDNAHNLVSNLKAISKGLSTFVKEIKNK